MASKAKPISLEGIRKSKMHRSNSEIETRKKAEQSLRAKTDKIKMPDWLLEDERATQEWEAVVPELIRLGLLTNLYIFPIAMYCRTVSVIESIETDLEAEGRTIEYTNVAGETNTIENPKINILKKYYQIAKDMLKEFGLTPAAMASMAIHKAEEEKEDPVAKFGV